MPSSPPHPTHLSGTGLTQPRLRRSPQGSAWGAGASWPSSQRPQPQLQQGGGSHCQPANVPCLKLGQNSGVRREHFCFCPPKRQKQENNREPVARHRCSSAPPQQQVGAFDPLPGAGCLARQGGQRQPWFECGELLFSWSRDLNRSVRFAGSSLQGDPMGSQL